jgi:hypothetical protein
MKTILSIPLVLLILFTGIKVNFATHWCGGHVAATKVSLNCELASCGMEKSPDIKSLNVIFTEECCKNTSSVYSICNNYVPSFYSGDDLNQQVITVHYADIDYKYSHEKIILPYLSDGRPPGTNESEKVSQPSLCIFRI